MDLKEKSKNQISIQQRFDVLKQNAPAMQKSTAKERIKLLKNLLNVVLKNRERFTEALFADYNRNPIETELADTWVVVKEIKFAIRNLEEWMRPKAVSTSLAFLGSSSHIQYEAKGVVLIIAPWNFPFNLTLGPLASALAAGNTVMIKPSEYTAHSSALLREIIAAVFTDEQVCLIEGGREVSEELLKLPFNHIFFTGSERVGKIVMRAAADHLASVTLELGGKSPVIVDETVNLKKVAQLVAYGKLCNNGQVCIGADYVYVKEEISAAFIAELNAAIAAMYGENDLLQNKDYARIVNQKQAETMLRLVDDAVEKGAIVQSSLSIDTDARFVSPVILSAVSDDMHIANEEIFGPILPIKTFSTLSEVIASVNANGKPLAMYIFSKNKKTIAQLLQEISAGAAVVNEVFLHHFNSNLPFGGVNKSGIGKSHGHFGFLEFTNQKAVVKQWLPWHVSSLLRPPYTKFSRFVVNTLFKYFS